MRKGNLTLWIGLGFLLFSGLVLMAPFGNALLELVIPDDNSSDPQGGMFDGFVVIFGTLPLGILLTIIGFIKLSIAKRNTDTQEGTVDGE